MTDRRAEETAGARAGDRPVPGTALVTGGARRIGHAICRRLAADGWRIALHYRGSKEAAEAASRDLSQSAGVAVAPLAADLADADAAASLVERAAQALGPVGLLVNNASIFEGPDWRAMTAAEIDRHMAVNHRAPLLLMQAFADALPPEAGGAIVNLIDERVWNPTPYFVAYTASKAALWISTRTMAQALAPRIRVNAIGPGPTLQGPHQTAAQFEAQWRAVPLARQTQPEEIAGAVAYLAGARAVTGQMLALDGGEHLGWRQATGGNGGVE